MGQVTLLLKLIEILAVALHKASYSHVKKAQKADSQVNALLSKANAHRNEADRATRVAYKINEFVK